MENSVNKDEMQKWQNDIYKNLKNVVRPCNTKTIHFDNTMSASDINAKIELENKYIPYGQTLTFQFDDGTYTPSTSLIFSGFFGGGNLIIQGNIADTTLSTSKNVYLSFSTNGIEIFSNNCNVYIRYLKIKITGAYIPINSSYNKFININANYVLGSTTSSGYGIQINTTPNGIIENNYISNLNYGILVYGTSSVYSYNNDDTGTQPAYGLYASRAIIFKRGTQPAGSSGNEVTNYGGQIY